MLTSLHAYVAKRAAQVVEPASVLDIHETLLSRIAAAAASARASRAGGDFGTTNSFDGIGANADQHNAGDI